MTENDPHRDLDAYIADLGTDIRLDAIAMVQAARRGDDMAQETIVDQTPDLKALVLILVHLCETILADRRFDADPDAVLTALQRAVLDAAGDS